MLDKIVTAKIAGKNEIATTSSDRHLLHDIILFMLKSRDEFLLVLGIGLFTAIHWLILVLEIPVLQSLPFWFFPLKETAVQIAWVAAALVLLSLAAYIVYSKAKIAFKLTSLILLGAFIQFSFAFSKGNGLEGLRDTLMNTGHADFARAASRQAGLIDVARNYEFLTDNGDLGAYASSKPPGTVLFYVLSNKLANLASPNAPAERQLENLQTFASIVWPFITYLVLVPIFLIGRQYFNDESALTACLLYLPIPSINLVILHTDQVIYPFLSALPAWLALRAATKRNYRSAFLAGAAYYLAVYFSFGLGMAILFIVLPFLIEFIKDRKSIKSISALTITAALGALVSNLLARLLLNYHIYFRYKEAIKHHVHWKGWEGGVGNLLRAGFTASTEFFVYLGIPLFILLIVSIGLALHRALILRKTDSASLFPLALFGTFGLLLLFGRTTSETARLWIFLIPFICLTAAHFIHTRKWTNKDRLWFIAYILLLEFGTVYFTLRHMDFV
jgi:hypothetical protein